MSEASSLISDARQYADTPIDNATASANFVFQLAMQLMAGLDADRNIELPAFNAELAEALGPIDTSGRPAFLASYEEPTGLPAAPDIRAEMEDAFRNSDPVTQAALTAAIDAYLNNYFPGFKAAVSALQSALHTGITTGQAVSDDFEQAIYNRLAQRIQAETRAAQRQVTDAMKRRGYVLPQITVSAQFARIAAESADRMAQSATETTIKRLEMELQHKQFCMSLMAQILQSVQSAVIQFAGIVASAKEFSLRYASAMADLLAKGYEVEADVFKTRLQAAVAKLQAAVDANRAGLAAYTAKLEAQKMQKQLEYDRMRLELMAAEIPYKAELERNIKQAELEVQALGYAINAAAHAMSAQGRIAEAALSSINAVAQISAEE